MMNFGSDNGMSKRRKVFYDEYSGGFYTETHIDELKRKCDYRTNMADVLNRSEEARLCSAIKTVNAARNLFELKREREVTLHRENLKDHIAYKAVLDHISKERDNNPNWDDKFGKYGMGVNKKDLEENIQLQLHEMDPMIRRKRQAEHILSNRKKVEVFDRKMNTEALLAMAHKQKHSSASPTRKRSPSKEPKEKAMPKLILPPITVTRRKEEPAGLEHKRVSIHGLDVSMTTPKPSPTPESKMSENSGGLPNIFVTTLDDN